MFDNKQIYFELIMMFKLFFLPFIFCYILYFLTIITVDNKKSKLYEILRGGIDVSIATDAYLHQHHI